MLKLVDMVGQYGFAVFIALFWVSVMAVKEVIEIWKWFRARLEEWRDKKNGIEKKDLSTDGRLSSLESSHTDMKNKIDLMYDLLQQQQKDNDEVIVANSRATLNTLAEQIKARGYMTETEYDTFMELSEIYLRKNGNHSMKDKIIPYIKSLPVKTL